jgi:hypothetical protein
MLSIGAGVLTSCAKKETPQSSPVSLLPLTPETQASSPPIPRPLRKPTPPPSIEPTRSTEAYAPAMASSNLLGPARATPSPAPSKSAAVSTSPDAPGSPPLQTAELIGLDQSTATRLFGPAAERSERPPATVWRYKNASCELDLFFYLDLRSGRMRTLHYALKGDGGDTAKRQDCLKSLLVERNN